MVMDEQQEPDQPSEHDIGLPDALDGFTLGKIVGNGAFSEVRLAHCKTRPELTLAIKMPDAKRLEANGQGKYSVDREVDILKSLHHPHIVKLYKVLSAPAGLHLVLDYYGGGDLYDFIAHHHAKLMTVDVAKLIVRQMLDAVCYMHKQNIVHRDLKAENILLTAREPPFSICITDFGFACRVQPSPPARNEPADGEGGLRIDTGAEAARSHLLTTHCGSEEYSAPEIIMSKPYDGKAADIWSAGVITYAVLAGYLPFAVEPRDVVVEEHVRVEQPVPENEPLTISAPTVIHASPTQAAFPNGALTTIEHASTAQESQPSTPVTDSFFSNASSSFPSPVHPRPTHASLPRLNSSNAEASSPATGLAGPLSYLALETPTTGTGTGHESSDGGSSPVHGGIPRKVTTVLRRRSTRKAGRRALWHRIARAEYTFPDETVVIVDNQPTPGDPNAAATAPQLTKAPLLSEDAKELIRAMLVGKPAKRETADMLLQHAWLRS
ncbi:hypothetical protein RI367_008306 [Sorochytrium milnesiophthora]